MKELFSRIKSFLLRVFGRKQPASGEAERVNDPDPARPLPYFDLDYGVVYSGIRKKGLTITAESDIVQLEKAGRGCKIHLREGESNTVALRPDVGYKTHALHFVNTGQGAAKDCAITVLQERSACSFAAARDYAPWEEKEILMIYSLDIGNVVPVRFLLAYADEYGEKHERLFDLRLELHDIQVLGSSKEK